jgi:hypothetical protein
MMLRPRNFTNRPTAEIALSGPCVGCWARPRDWKRRVAIEAAKGGFDEGIQTLEEFTGAHVPKRQFEELPSKE